MARTTARAAGALALAVLAVVLIAAPAQAAAYRYWTYWQAAPAATTWTFATQGAGTAVPADGAVEGWAFGITTASADPDDAPEQAPDFEAVCGGTPAEPGRKRVALVIDPGPAAVAPEGDAPPAATATCVVAASDATGYEVLRSVAEVRTEAGLVCGVGGYPTTECAPTLDDAEAATLLAAAAVPSAPTSTTAAGGSVDGTDAGSPLPTLAVLGGLVLGGALLLGWSRRRRTDG